MSTPPTTSSKLLLLGATGATGRYALLSALKAPTVSTVYSIGRRAPDLPADTPGLNKLKHEAFDYDALLSNPAGSEANKLKSFDADAVVIALGTTRAQAGSAEAFVKIDREYVLAAAKAAKVEKAQKLVYCSSGGSSSSSPFLYIKSKGLTEEGLAALEYSDTTIYKPGMLLVPGGRGDHRLAEILAAKVTGFLSYFTNSIEIKTDILGAALVRSAFEGKEGASKLGLGKEEDHKGYKVWAVYNADAAKYGEGF